MAAAAERRLVRMHRPVELAVVGGENRAELITSVGALRRFLSTEADVPLAAVAHALHRDCDPACGTRLAIVATDTADLERRLERAQERLRDPACTEIADVTGTWYSETARLQPGGTVAMYPGEGSQYDGMLEDLSLGFDVVRRVFDLAARALPSWNGGRAVASAAGESARAAMQNAIAGVIAGDLALRALMDSLAFRPDVVVGHSAGEFAALLASGATSVRDDHELVRWMTDGLSLAHAVELDGLVASATLLALGNVKRTRLMEALAERAGLIHLAMDNCPRQIVLCGDDIELQALVRELGSASIAQRLPFGRPYHTPLFEPVVDRLQDFYDRLPLAVPGCPLWSCTTAGPLPPDPDAVRRVSREQWMRPVRFRETVEAMYEAGIRIFVEVGPHGRLASFVRDTLGRRAHLALATDRPGHGMEQLHHTLAQLTVRGVPLDLDALYRSRAIDPLPQGALWDGRVRKPPSRTPLSLSLPIMTVGNLALPRPASPSLGRSAGSPPSMPDPPAGIERARAGMAAYARTMTHFLAVQEGTFRAALERVPPGVTPAEAPQSPRLEATRTESFAVGRDRWLRDHVLGPAISRDPSLAPLAVLPLAVAVELMAATAADCRRGDHQIVIDNVRLTRWVVAVDGVISIELRARGCGGDEVQAQLCYLTPDEDRGVAARATISGGTRLHERPALEPLSSPRPWPWPLDTLYEQGRRRGMFHGPSLQGVVTIDGIGEDGADATLRTDLPLPPGLATASSRVAPGMLDAAGQVLGFWAAACLERGFVIFPNGFDRLSMHCSPVDIPPRVHCRMRVREVLPDGLAADLEIVGENGEPLVSIVGWTATRHDLPEDLYTYCVDPAHSSLGHPWLDALDGSVAANATSCCRVWLPPGILEAHGGIWELVLAHIALSGAERERWRALPANGRRQEWLLGRVAAKDAVRTLYRQRGDAVPYPADVQIANDGAGAPRATSRSDGALADVSVSIAHTAGVAAAVAAEPGAVRGVGIDIEAAHRATDRLDRAAFDADEREAIRPLAATDPTGTMRAWCAKEAAAKALGTGMVYGPHALRVLALDPISGKAEVVPSGRLLAAQSWLGNTRVMVHTVRDADLVAATAVVDGTVAADRNGSE